MQKQRDVDAWLPDQDEVAGVILSILIQRYPALIAINEIVHELTEPSLQQTIEEPLIHDALVDLTTSGLVHRLDKFVFPTFAAMRASQLVV